MSNECCYEVVHKYCTGQDISGNEVQWCHILQRGCYIAINNMTFFPSCKSTQAPYKKGPTGSAKQHACLSNSALLAVKACMQAAQAPYACKHHMQVCCNTVSVAYLAGAQHVSALRGDWPRHAQGLRHDGLLGLHQPRPVFPHQQRSIPLNPDAVQDC